MLGDWLTLHKTTVSWLLPIYAFFATRAAGVDVADAARLSFQLREDRGLCRPGSLVSCSSIRPSSFRR